jgi:hypothetical protein
MTSPAVNPDDSIPSAGRPGLLFFGAHRRSGTTWMTAMLNSHPQLHMRNEGWMFNERGCSFPTWLDEPRFRAWAGSREARGTWLRDLSADEAARILRRAMLRALMEEATRRETWKQFDRLRWIGDKTTMFYTRQIDDLFGLFPDARFLSMIRDGRDAVVSNLFLLLRERNFHELPPHCSAEAVAAADRLAAGQADGSLFGPALLRHLAQQWAESVHGARRAERLYAPVGGFCQVRYEDVVAAPEQELARVLTWLGVAAEPSLVRSIVADNVFERSAGGRRPGQEDPLAEWRKGIVGDWRNRFSSEDRRVFKAVAGTLLVELGYEAGFDW